MTDTATVKRLERMALQLRFLQTITEISSEHSTNTIIPLPIDILSPYL